MSISLTKRKFLISLTGLTLGAGWLGAGFLYWIDSYFSDYPLIPAYFFLFSIFFINMLERCRDYQPQKILIIYLAIKVIKIVFTVMVLLIYCYFFRAHAKEFLLTFIAIYFIYLIFEVRFFLAFEEVIKKRNNKHETKE